MIVMKKKIIFGQKIKIKSARARGFWGKIGPETIFLFWMANGGTFPQHLKVSIFYIFNTEVLKYTCKYQTD